jgi:hypothetical protein
MQTGLRLASHPFLTSGDALGRWDFMQWKLEIEQERDVALAAMDWQQNWLSPLDPMYCYYRSSVRLRQLLPLHPISKGLLAYIWATSVEVTRILPSVSSSIKKYYVVVSSAPCHRPVRLQPIHRQRLQAHQAHPDKKRTQVAIL